ncbi:MAG: adenosylcobinamide-GDP ribazoletransferase [Gammaproteobacteria bacterium]
MDSLLVALQFLTRLPISRQLNADDETLGSSVLYYPLVGFVIGVLLNVLALVFSAAPEMVAATLVLCGWVWLTGGLHLDGLADCADAFVGGLGDRQRSLQIMKDPSAGPIAVVALILLLLLKWCAIVVLIQQNNLHFLMLAPLLGRCAILLLMLSTPYVSPQGIAERLIQYMPITEVRQVVIASLIFSGFIIGWFNVLLVGALVLSIRAIAVERLGGSTGDVYGAAVELVETVAMLTAVIS